MGASKIRPLIELAAHLRTEQKKGKSVVLCHGVFDLIHPGHIRHFAEAKEQGDLLVVTLTEDKFVNKGPGRPAFNERLRAETLAALGDVDFVGISPAPTAVEVIKTLMPNVYVKGSDYENKKSDVTKGIYAEEEAVKEVGARLHFTHDITFSSSSLLNTHLGVYPEKSRQFLDTIKKEFSADEVIERLDSLSDLKVLVLGDTIVDEYFYCQPLGKSPKETIVATRYLEEEAFPGGILACANHIAAFCEQVDLVTCLGSLESKQELIESKLKENVRPKFFFRDDARTVIKRRYVEPAFLTKMFQMTYLTDTDLPTETSQSVCRYLLESLGNYDLIVVADYGHGFIDQRIREVIQSKSPFLALNVQTNSANLGYNLVTKYHHANYISIDEPELRLAMQARYDSLYPLVERFSSKYPSSVITITRGHQGSMTVMPNEEREKRNLFFEAAALSGKVVDRVGAGDAYFAISALLAAKKAPASLLAFVGNAAGAMAVETVCNRSSVQAVPTFKFIRSLLS